MPEHLDDAFLRAGRFDYKIPFLYPGPQARLEILLVHLGYSKGGRRDKVPTSIDENAIRDFLWEAIVPSTRNFSCAELEELVTRAKRFAFDRERTAVAGEDLLMAAKTFRIDASSRRRTIEACMSQARRYTDDQTFLDAVEQENRVSEEDEAAGES